MYLYHYFDKSIGPFKNLSDISLDKANFGPERYIEVQVWSDKTIKKYCVI